ncbi:hypothetical protein SCWH03_34280 [Streptomyces pacificus]|uniref:Uncharacterized protein n=1 Tax=Streptomyces pacificus TaxID=2705029 RepID=A0A6A0AWF4_9ACTN|nr:hypothetical protein SCWH03_34280 [Streptomyces pacificus]
MDSKSASESRLPDHCMGYNELMEVDLGKLGTAVTDWKRVAGEMQRLGGEARDGMKAKAGKARWEGVNAGVTRDFVGKTVKEFADLHAEAQSIFSVLDDAHTELKRIQQQARSVTADAKEAGFSVTGRKGGSVVIADALICEVHGPGQRKRDMRRPGLPDHRGSPSADAAQSRGVSRPRAEGRGRMPERCVGAGGARDDPHSSDYRPGTAPTRARRTLPLHPLAPLSPAPAAPPVSHSVVTAPPRPEQGTNPRKNEDRCTSPPRSPVTRRPVSCAAGPGTRSPG